LFSLLNILQFLLHFKWFRSLILFRVLFLRAKTTNWFTNSRIILILLREMHATLWENSFVNSEIVQVFQMVHFGMGNLVQHKVSTLYSIFTSFFTPTIFCGLPTARNMLCRWNDVQRLLWKIIEVASQTILESPSTFMSVSYCNIRVYYTSTSIFLKMSYLQILS